MTARVPNVNPNSYFQHMKEPVTGVFEYKSWPRRAGAWVKGLFGLSFDIKNQRFNTGSLARYICEKYVGGENPLQHKKLVRQTIAKVLKQTPPDSLDMLVEFVLKELSGKGIRAVLNIQTEPDDAAECAKISQLFKKIPGASSKKLLQEGGAIGVQHIFDQIQLQADQKELEPLQLAAVAADRLRTNILGTAQHNLNDIWPKLKAIEQRLPESLKDILDLDQSFENYQKFVEKLRERTGNGQIPTALSKKEEVLRAASSLADLQSEYDGALAACDAAIKTFDDLVRVSEQIEIDVQEQAQRGADLKRDVDAARHLPVSVEGNKSLREKQETLSRVIGELRKKIEEWSAGLDSSTEELCQSLQRAGIQEAAVAAVRQQTQELKSKIQSGTATKAELQKYQSMMKDLSQKMGQLTAMQRELESIAPEGEIRKKVQSDFDRAQAVVTSLRHSLESALESPREYSVKVRQFDQGAQRWDECKRELQTAVYLLGARDFMEMLRREGFEVTSLEQSLKAGTSGSEKCQAFLSQFRDRFGFQVDLKSPFLDQVKKLFSEKLRLNFGKATTLEDYIKKWREWVTGIRGNLSQDFRDVDGNFPGLKEGFERARANLLRTSETSIPSSASFTEARALCEYAKELRDLSQQYTAAKAKQKETESQHNSSLGDPAVRQILSALKGLQRRIESHPYGLTVMERDSLRRLIGDYDAKVRELENAFLPSAKMPIPTKVPAKSSVDTYREEQEKQIAEFEDQSSRLLSREGEDDAAIDQLLGSISTFRLSIKSKEQQEAFTNFSRRMSALERELGAAKQQILARKRGQDLLRQQREAVQKAAYDLLTAWDLKQEIDFAPVTDARARYPDKETDPSVGLEECVDLFRALEDFRTKKTERGGYWCVVKMDRGKLTTGTTWLTWPSTAGIPELLRDVREKSLPLLMTLSAPTREKMISALGNLGEVYDWDEGISSEVEEFVTALREGK